MRDSGLSGEPPGIGSGPGDTASDAFFDRYRRAPVELLFGFFDLWHAVLDVFIALAIELAGVNGFDAQMVLLSDFLVGITNIL